MEQFVHRVGLNRRRIKRMNDLDILFQFKTNPKIFWKERNGVKNNTVRRIDLSDDRFTHLIAWSEIGWNDGDILIEIVNTKNSDSFIREIRDITIWDDLIIITWNPHKKYDKTTR